MDDQTWINLQKLVGRGPQPSLLDPQTPDHILYADALTALGGGPPSPGPTPYRLLLADALQAHGRTATPDARPATLYADASQAYDFGLTPDTSFARQNGGPSPQGNINDATTAPRTLYAMGSPADVDLPWQTMADQYAEPPTRPKSPPPQAPAAPSSLQTAIDPIPGYDETGDNAWRSANDQIFLDAVNRYNAANGYRLGDPGYWTADMLKAQAMVETGGDPDAFMTDPLQVNTKGNWADEKTPVAGLTRGQPMNPQVSADAALKWLHYKGWMTDKQGNRGYVGDESALWRYIGDPTPRSHYSGNSWDKGLTEQDWYADQITRLAREAAEARTSTSGKR